jgi:hypothetical protein
MRKVDELIVKPPGDHTDKSLAFVEKYPQDALAGFTLHNRVERIVGSTKPCTPEPETPTGCFGNRALNALGEFVNILHLRAGAIFL